MQTILTVIQVFLSLGLIVLILIQHGKGADAGAAFGSGASATVFGARGSGSFLTRATAILATIFFLTSMALAYYATKSSEPPTLMDDLDEAAVLIPGPVPAATDVPAVPGATTLPFGSSDVPAVTTLPEGGSLDGGSPGQEPAASIVIEGEAQGAPEAVSAAQDIPAVAGASEVSGSATDAADQAPVASGSDASGAGSLENTPEGQ